MNETLNIIFGFSKTCPKYISKNKPVVLRDSGTLQQSADELGNSTLEVGSRTLTIAREASMYTNTFVFF